VVEREASGDFDYLFDDSADSDGLTSGDAVLDEQPAEQLESAPKDPGDDLWDEPDDNFWDNQPDFDDYPNDNGHFDAFNDNTWHFTPAPPPWYRTKQSLAAIVAASAALAAIVVSGVLLVFRGPANTVDEMTGSVSQTAPTSAETVPVATSAEPPPPPPPPPATASPVDTAPRYNPTYQPRPTKAPEIGVTRTPVTRAPISVAPQPRTGQHALR
jgi:hypothetical protein